jgi:predicted ATPase/class 3 adenylate cyclase
MAILPQGTVTFLFTDIEGSTRLVQDLGPAYRDVLERHQSLLRDAFSRGVEVGTEGDSFFVAFASATDAVAAAAAGQLALAAEAWPEGHPVRVRMGLHTGQANPGADGYVGYDVHRAARIAAAGHGGQVLLSESTHSLVRHDLPDGVTVRDLGPHRLKDLTTPERISQLVVGGLDDDFPALRTLDSSRTNLPAQLTSFVGRERELGELQALARAHRLVTVIGTGGTGKTRLMLQASAELVGEQADGVWLVELAPISDPEMIVQAVARGLGIREDGGRPLMDTVVDFLRTKSLLILLDNCEHLIGTCAELAEQVLASSSGVSLVASSREALGVTGEHVYQVPSLELPDEQLELDDHGGRGASFDKVRDAEAVRLFVERATAVLPSFTLTPADAPAVVEICRRLDGIPLAIELAAARVPLLSVQEIAMRLGDRFRLLTGGRRTALPRQQTLQALIDWSWDLLTEDERRLLRRLSVFAGGCTLEAASTVARLPDEAVPGGDASLDTLDALGRLVGRSLVVVDRGGSTRYHLLETIRQYARDRLVAADETTELRNRHLAFYLRLALDAEPKLLSPDLAAWLVRLDADADNLRAAIDWAFEEDPAAGLRLCVALSSYWRARSLAEGLDHLRRAAELARRIPRRTGSARCSRPARWRPRPTLPGWPGALPSASPGRARALRSHARWTTRGRSGRR